MPINETLLHGPFYGNFYVRLVGALGFAFLMGSIPFGSVAVWLFGELDARVASTARGLAPIFDMVKALIPAAIVTHGAGPVVGGATAFAAVLGHYYCPWLRWRGAPGSAAEFGALCGLCWQAGVFFALMWLVGAIASDYAVAGTVLATTFAIVSIWYFLGAKAALFGVASLLAVLGGNREVLARLARGTEPTMSRRNELAAETTSVVRLDGQPVQSF